MLGFTSNLDVLLEWDEGAFNAILDSFLTGQPAIRNNDTIHSIEDFARIISAYVIRGQGGEVDITDNAVCTFLENHFRNRYALGGTAAQGATALNTLGFPVLVHISDRSQEVCQLMDRPGISTVTESGLVPIIQAASAELPVRHIILQFPKGAKIRIQNETVEIPQSNRVIMDYDSIHKNLIIDENFRQYCEEHAGKLPCYAISGFNAIVNTDIMQSVIRNTINHLRAVKARNPGCIIYLEAAHYLNPAVEEIVFSQMAPHIDILGLNEEELTLHARQHQTEIHPEDPASVLAGLRCFRQRYSIRGLLLHTKDYSLYFGEELANADITKGLTIGNLIAGTRARIGRYGTWQDCLETLSQPLSPTGLAFHDTLTAMEPDIQIVPSRYIENPGCMIGLGDTFMAGVLTAFL